MAAHSWKEHLILHTRTGHLQGRLAIMSSPGTTPPPVYMSTCCPDPPRKGKGPFDGSCSPENELPQRVHIIFRAMSSSGALEAVQRSLIALEDSVGVTLVMATINKELPTAPKKRRIGTVHGPVASHAPVEVIDLTSEESKKPSTEECPN